MAVATAPRNTAEQHEQPAPPKRARTALRVVPPPGGQRVPLRLSVRRIGILSAARTAAVLATLVAIALVGAGVAVWWAASSMGLVEGMEETVASGLGLDSWSLPAAGLLALWVALAAAFAVLTVLVVVLLVVAFNGMGRTIGGVDVVARAERLDRRS